MMEENTNKSEGLPVQETEELLAKHEGNFTTSDEQSDSEQDETSRRGKEREVINLQSTPWTKEFQQDVRKVFCEVRTGSATISVTDIGNGHMRASTTYSAPNGGGANGPGGGDYDFGPCIVTITPLVATEVYYHIEWN